MITAKRVDLSGYKPQSAEQINTAIAQNIESYITSFNSAFSSALQSYQKLQEESQKTDIQHVYICFLRSSITQQLPFFRIDLYNEADIEDMEKCCADWDVIFPQGPL